MDIASASEIITTPSASRCPLAGDHPCQPGKLSLVAFFCLSFHISLSSVLPVSCPIFVPPFVSSRCGPFAPFVLCRTLMPPSRLTPPSLPAEVPQLPPYALLPSPTVPVLPPETQQQRLLSPYHCRHSFSSISHSMLTDNSFC